VSPSVCPSCGHPLSPQLDLADLEAVDPHRKARRTDGATARNAAVLAFPRGANQRRRLLEAVAATPDGLTAEQAALLTGITYVSSSTRLSELVEGGWLLKTDRTRKTSAGVDAAVLEATDAARERLRGAVAA
jgi:hypothetical protein